MFRAPLLMYGPKPDEAGRDCPWLLGSPDRGEESKIGYDLVAALETFRRDLRVARAGPLLDPRIVERLVALDAIAETPLGRSAPSARVGLVTTAWRPGEGFLEFIAHHRRLGVERIFVTLDDPDDPLLPALAAIDGVEVTPCDDALRARWREVPVVPSFHELAARHVMARQTLNANLALARARELGLDWLIHIDADEAIWSPVPLDRVFGLAPDDVGLIAMSDCEMVHERMDYDDPAREIRLYKRNGFVVRADDALNAEIERLVERRPHFYMGYQNGKSAVRALPGAFVTGVHSMRPPRSAPRWGVAIAPPVVLHYISSGFRAFVEKYQRLGDISDYYYDQPRQPLHPFHRLSRDAVRDLDPVALREFFRRHCVYDDPEEIAELLARGLLVRLDPL